MAIKFDNLPADKPNNNSVSKGRYSATVFKSEIQKGKTSGNEYLNVSFQLDGGGFVNENYFDSDKPFLMYKLGQLLKACQITLEGEGTLKDVKKVIQGKKVIIDVDVNDKGYGCVDYSGNNDGLYPINNAPIDKKYGAEEAEDMDLGEEASIDPEIDQAIEDDEDF